MIVATFVVLCAAAVAFAIRLVRGPSLSDRVVAVNGLLLESRRRTMTIPGAAEKAARYHLLVALAVRDGAAEQARAVMEQHVRDVAQDAGAGPPRAGRAPTRTGRTPARTSRSQRRPRAVPGEVP